MGVVRPSALPNFLYLPISELLPSGGQIGGPGRATKPCVLPRAWKRVQERSKGGGQVVSCSGVYLALVGGLPVRMFKHFPGVPRRHQRCWVGLDLQRQVPVGIRGIHRLLNITL